MLISNDVQSEIARVFMDPSERPSDERRPLLYLLRRDLKDQYGGENEQVESVQIKSPLLICLGIMVGFELLTKMYSGKHEFEKSGEGKREVKKFMLDILEIGGQEAGALIKFRNSLAHSYGLGIGKNQTLTVDDDAQSASREVSVNNLGGNKQEIYINVWHLKELFVQAVATYKNRLVIDFELQKNFVCCLANLGEIRIQGSEKSRG